MKRELKACLSKVGGQGAYYRKAHPDEKGTESR